eukprot:1011074-Pleurochrysis_carterae.AAC.1
MVIVGGYVRVVLFIYARRDASASSDSTSSSSSSSVHDYVSSSSSSAPDSYTPLSSQQSVPDSLPPSPPGSDDEGPDDAFAAHYLQPSEGEEELFGLPPRARRGAE